jgi:hypothetical protein
MRPKRPLAEDMSPEMGRFTKPPPYIPEKEWRDLNETRLYWEG